MTTALAMVVFSASPGFAMVRAVQVAPDCPDDPPGSAPLEMTDVPAGTDAVACGLLDEAIMEGDIAVGVPEPGASNSIIVEYANPTPEQAAADTFTVTVTSDGILNYDEIGDGGNPDDQRANPCTDDASNLLGIQWYHDPVWYYKLDTTPIELNADDTRGAIRAAIRNMTGVNNDCGYGDYVGIDGQFAGDTDKNSSANQFFADGKWHETCNDGDGTSMVSWGDLPDGVVAYTCPNTILHPGNAQITSADIKLNRQNYHWTLNGSAPGCNNQWDVESVATHEFGHFFGLAHVRSHVLTMLNGGPAALCRTMLRTLGQGDVIGLNLLY